MSFSWFLHHLFLIFNYLQLFKLSSVLRKYQTVILTSKQVISAKIVIFLFEVCETLFLNVKYFKIILTKELFDNLNNGCDEATITKKRLIFSHKLKLLTS